MVGILTLITDAPALIADFGAAIVAIETVWPDAEAAEQAILSAVLTPLKKIRADVEAMPAAGGTPGAIVNDVETFFGDLADIATALESLVPMAESKGEALWQQLVAPVAKIKVDVQALLPSAPVAAVA